MANDIEIIRNLLKSSEPIKWLFSGDSITHGALHTFGWRDYSELVSERLRYEMGRGRDCVIKTAISGWRLVDVLPDLEWSVLQYKAHVVSIAFGMNDCAAGESALGQFEKNYTEMVRRVRENSNAAIIINTPPHIMPTDTVRWGSLPAYADAIRRVAQATDAVLVDHHDQWRKMDYGPMTYLMSDAIHPNEMGHRAMGKLWMQHAGIWDANSFTGRLYIP